ncbi:PMP-22/EMP/MP20/Claudin [Dermatophagoides farinae]|uniref:PMP-22/EMP/MP20/Claudin n=1 Tax=Dermatophagoides farinae TaxID=6954 RepID=A0A922KZ40_DERFA|nr:PMP-22/EMP/MP20/Claudin [Dermatophagoides farinae]
MIEQLELEQESTPIFKMMSVKSIRALRLLMPMVAMISLLTQSVAIITNDWLHTIESMPNTNYEKFSMPAEMEFFKKSTSSGLWTLCYNEPPDTELECKKIDYLSQEEYIPDQNDSTMAIPYAVKQAAIYFLVSTGLMIAGQTIYLMSQLCRSRRIYIFVSGIPFILSGLLILTGIVVYISTFKNEVGYKLRPISQFQDALFDYRYGYSFLFLVTSLLLSELTGTLAIFLYVSQKHFKIMIDTERDQVLTHNIINLLRNQQQQQKMVDDDDDDDDDDHHVRNKDGVVSSYPRLGVISSSDNDQGYHMNDGDAADVTVTPQSPIARATINQNFLSVDFGLLDSAAYYQCGRHGTRGRRNSRSNDSYLGSPRESTTELKTQRRVNEAQKSTGRISFDSAVVGDSLQELYVEGLDGGRQFIKPRNPISNDDDDSDRFFLSSAQHLKDDDKPIE